MIIIRMKPNEGEYFHMPSDRSDPTDAEYKLCSDEDNIRKPDTVTN